MWLQRAGDCLKLRGLGPLRRSPENLLKAVQRMPSLIVILLGWLWLCFCEWDSLDVRDPQLLLVVMPWVLEERGVKESRMRRVLARVEDRLKGLLSQQLSPHLKDL